MKPTALNCYLGVVCTGSEWLMVSFDSQGNWKAFQKCATKEAAQEARRNLRKHHAKIVKQRKRNA